MVNLMVIVALLCSATTTGKAMPIPENVHFSGIKRAQFSKQSDVVPQFTKEVQSHFMPMLYGDATRITFSNGISFDTKNLGKDGEPDLPIDLIYTTDEANYYIVQFNGPIHQAQRDWLESIGVKIHFVMPRYGFVCRVTNQKAVEQISANPSVNWIGIYQPAYKISALFDRVGEEHKVTILLFLDADIAEVLEQVKTVSDRSDFITSDNGINKIIQGIINLNHILLMCNGLSRVVYTM